jgi:hypothetical protein
LTIAIGVLGIAQSAIAQTGNDSGLFLELGDAISDAFDPLTSPWETARLERQRTLFDPIPIISMGWQNYTSKEWKALTGSGVKTNVGLGGYIDPANSNIFITAGFGHGYNAGDRSRQVNQLGGFQGEVERVNTFEAWVGIGRDFGPIFEFGDEDWNCIPHLQVEGRFRLGGADVDFVATGFDPAKPQVIVSDPQQSGVLVGGDLVATLGCVRPWGSIGVEVTAGLTGTSALTGDWTTTGNVGVGGVVTLNLGWPESDDVRRVREYRAGRRRFDNSANPPSGRTIFEESFDRETMREFQTIP